MRRLIHNSLLFAVAMLAALAFPGCKREERARLNATEEEPPGLASIVHVADPRTAAQLLKGFYDVEQNSWRWTTGKFAVALRPPLGATQQGATLTVKLTIPDPVIQSSKRLTLTAAVGNVTLPAETYTQAGEYTFSRDVPAGALAGNSVTVQFSLDKTIPPSGADRRELGIVVTTVGLEPK